MLPVDPRQGGKEIVGQCGKHTNTGAHKNTLGDSKGFVKDMPALEPVAAYTGPGGEFRFTR
jgi:hypothetical protein